MVSWNNATQIKEQIALVELLAKLGHHPEYRSGKELYYISMLRKEQSASFCIDDNLGVWYDHGGANSSGIKGGNIIDFGLAFWYPMPLKDVLTKIAGVMDIPFTEITDIDSKVRRPRFKAAKVSNYDIETIKELDNHPAITRYLKSRGIWEVASSHIKEVYYTIKSGPKAGRQFFSAGWQNDNGGWELRNRIVERDFKSCLGKKGITTLPGCKEAVSIFEGFLDYLSWKMDNPHAPDSIVVLNSVSLMESAVNKLNGYFNVNVYFDNDNAGKAALLSLKNVIPNAVDRSYTYAKYKDYNELLLAKQNKNLLFEEANIYQKMMAYYKR
ncbi:toprim domain-containing protein [Sphingobacterium sp. SGL-16]|uniref:toprim domain-containing protein n=1 Tax=Sphingobacterium sp. SGL-16 TaxID=2710883 RepID=UPI0013EC6A92|nr:toprim domain-containing protein [Sphingobacterium sp. SGL-16]NGM71639.1 toprim domain-containing protein [Sphingobacterium sp. SGL-16]